MDTGIQIIKKISVPVIYKFSTRSLDCQISQLDVIALHVFQLCNFVIVSVLI
jgi:hypothetical protein